MTQLSRMPSWDAALTRSDLPSTAKLVGLVLATFMNRQTETAWPSLNTLAQRASVNRSTITRALEELERRGWVERIQRTVDGGKEHRTTLYRPRIPATALVQEAPTVGAGSNNIEPKKREKVSPTEIPQATGPTKDERAEIFSALAKAWGVDLKHLTSSARGRIGREVNSLWAAGVPEDAVHGDGRPYTMGEMVLALGAWWRRAYPNVECTPQSISREYPRFCSGEFQSMAAAAEDDREERATARRRLNGRG